MSKTKRIAIFVLTVIFILLGQKYVSAYTGLTCWQSMMYCLNKGLLSGRDYYYWLDDYGYTYSSSTNSAAYYLSWGSGHGNPGPNGSQIGLWNGHTSFSVYSQSPGRMETNLITNFYGSTSGNSSLGMGPFYLNYYSTYYVRAGSSGATKNVVFDYIKVFNTAGTDVTGYVGFYSDAECTKEITTFTSSTKFYIKLKDNYCYKEPLKQIQARVYTDSFWVYGAEVYIYKTNAQGVQDLAYVSEQPLSSNNYKYQMWGADTETLTLNDTYSIYDATIAKTDEDTEEPLQGAKFKLKVFDKENENTWVREVGTRNGIKYYTYDNSYENATVYRTDSEGNINVEDLVNGRYYTVFEVGAPEGYKLEDQNNYYASLYGHEMVFCYYATDGSPNQNITNDRYYQVYVEKKSEGDNVPLNIDFKIKRTTDGQWVQGEAGGEKSYTSDISKATVYNTGGNGKAERILLDLNESYEIYEVKSYNDDYPVSAQAGYDSENDYVKKAEIETTNSKTEIEKTELGVYNTQGIKLSITKKDDKKGTLLKGVGFKLYSVTDQKWVSGDGNLHKYNNEFANATEYFTNDSGELVIEHLKEGEYYLIETTAADQYDLTDQEKYWNVYRKDSEVLSYDTGIVTELDRLMKKYDLVFVDKITLVDDHKAGQLEVKKEYENERYAVSLEVSKLDKHDNSRKLENAGFKIYYYKNDSKQGWLAGQKDSYEYKANYADGEIYTTDANGNLTLEEVEFGNYYVYEVQAPDGYYLQMQRDLEISTQLDYSEKSDGTIPDGIGYVKYNGEICLSANSDKAQGPRNPEDPDNIEKVLMKMENTEMILNITGYVWIDVPNTKSNSYNSLYDEGEQKLEKVTVNFKRKKDNSLVKTVETNKDEYIFEFDPNDSDTSRNQIRISELQNYYMEFDYSTLENGKYKQYIPVAFNGSETNSSKALYDDVAEKDTELTGIVTTYPRDDETREKSYGLSGEIKQNLLDPYTSALTYINLGIKKIPDTDYEIDENIAEVNVTMKGYTYKYIYGGKGNTSLINAPTVNWQTKGDIAAYTRAIYPSDIAYDKEKSTKELEVDVTYRIDITNTEKTNIEELYQEKSLTVTKLTNEFDTYRYSLSKKEKYKSENDLWEVEEERANTIVLNYNGLSNMENISNEDTKNYATTYITFSINHDALLDILNNPGGITEEFPTKATAMAYHNYTRTDYSWKNDITGIQNHKTEEKEKADNAPYLILKLGETRKIKGTVFEDGVETTNGEVLGSGQYEDNENVVSNVKVDLLDVDGTTISTLYKVDNGSTTTEEATTTTGKDGNFVLEGMVPGEYYLRFTYADGSQKVYTSKGEEITDIDLSKYKSTIVTSERTKEALQAGEGEIEDKEWIWYKNLEALNYSVAVDDLEQKAKYNYKTATSVYADTARTSITIESTKDDFIQIEVTDKGQSVGQNEKFVGFNFGIIRQPVASETIEKVISNVRLINSQNNIIFDGNPATDTLTGVSDLSAESSKLGSTFTRVEIDENELYGSTLIITYTIRITNTSEVNYYGKNYYWFGDKDGANEVTLSIDEISDYLDNKLVFVSCNHNTEVTTEKEGRQLVRITNIGELYTIQNTERKETKQTSTDVILTAKRVLSSEDDDMEFINTVYFKAITNSGHPEQPKEYPTPKPTTEIYRAIPQPEIPTDGSTATATVTPPTGADRQSGVIYIIIGIAALVVLSTGIVIIKKKIL